jgi:DNA-directed RNA polymerase omega subunit
MSKLSPEDFEGKIDSMYRLVIVGARRATQVSKPEIRALVPVRSKKSTITALEEIAQGKVSYRTDADDEDEFVE